MPIISEQDTGEPQVTTPANAATPDGAAVPGDPAESRRGLLMTAALAALGALIIIIAAGRDWVHGQTAEVTAPVVIGASGKTLTGVPYALALAGLAGALALLATRAVGRLLTAVVLLAAGIGAAVATVFALGGLHRELADKVAARFVGHSDPVVTHVSATMWPYLTVVGAALVVAAGVVAVWHGRRWPGMSSRYEAPASSSASGRPGSTTRHSARPEDSASIPAARAPGDSAPAARELWDALDRGEDPTG